MSASERNSTPPHPSSPVSAPGSSRTWDSSITGLVDLGKAIVLWAVSWAIWIPLYLIGAIIVWSRASTALPAFDPESPQADRTRPHAAPGPRTPSHSR